MGATIRISIRELEVIAQKVLEGAGVPSGLDHDGAHALVKPALCTTKPSLRAGDEAALVISPCLEDLKLDENDQVFVDMDPSAEQGAGLVLPFARFPALPPTLHMRGHIETDAEERSTWKAVLTIGADAQSLFLKKLDTQ